MRPIGERIINPGANEIIYIATFGRHFELIVQGPHYELSRDPDSTIHGVEMYEPKVNIHNTYIAESDIRDEDPQIVQANINLVELVQNIRFFESELKNVELNIAENEKELKYIYASNIDDVLKAMRISSIEPMIIENSRSAEKLRRMLSKMQEERLTLESIVNG